MKIFRALKEAEKAGEGFLTVSKIAKATKLHKWTVSRTLDIYMFPYIEINTPEGFDDVGLQIKFVRLKDPSMEEKQALRFLKMRNIIRERD